jgi:hypothetical protein
MLTFIQFITEAAPTAEIHNTDYYHGTTSREAALGIAKNGIQPPPPKKHPGHLTPVPGKVYVTPHLKYAQIYAIGGDMAGHDHKMAHHEKDPYGYVFKVHGHKMKDVQPDEDSVGQMVNSQKHPWLNDLAKRHLTARQHANVTNRFAEYAHESAAGKKLVKHMTDWQKHELIKHGAHVAHHGPLQPDEVYRIHHSKIKHLKSDGSNFFDHAEKIGTHEI